MPKDKVTTEEAVEALHGDAPAATGHPMPHALEVCAVCKHPLEQQRYRALDKIVCSMQCAAVVHGDA